MRNNLQSTAKAVHSLDSAILANTHHPIPSTTNPSSDVTLMELGRTAHQQAAIFRNLTLVLHEKLMGIIGEQQTNMEPGDEGLIDVLRSSVQQNECTIDQIRHLLTLIY